MMILIIGCMTNPYPQDWIQTPQQDTSTQEETIPSSMSVEGNWYGELYLDSGEGFFEYEDESSCFFALLLEHLEEDMSCTDCSVAYSFSIEYEIENQQNCSESPEVYGTSIALGFHEEVLYHKIQGEWNIFGWAMYVEEDNVWIFGQDP